MPVATAVRERPILFSGDMVRAILAGTKTQTRRVVKGDGEFNRRRCPYGEPGDRLWVREAWQADFDYPGATGFPWWNEIPAAFRGPKARYVYYRADKAVVHAPSADELEWPLPYEARISTPDYDSEQEAAEDAEILRNIRWRPSIHMPRWASRISLEITDVRCERLQAISEEDARAEGVERDSWPEDWTSEDAALEAECGYFAPRSYAAGYAALWDSLNAARGFGWHTNPWVWAITFKRAEG
jgi:hypothetical protein